MCAVVALLGVPTAAHGAVGRDPDDRPRSSSTRTLADDSGSTRTARTVDRIGGTDRYATAVAASRAAFPASDPAGTDTVYLASGAQYADALSAGPTAVARGAGLLLTRADRLPDVVAAELRRLAPDRVVVVGGTGAVHDKVLDQVRALGSQVSRLAGTDRYATSEALAREGFPDGARTAWVTTGQGYADALAAGPVAATEGGPVVLVDGRSPVLPSSTRQLLTDLGVTGIRIAGGTASVSSGIEQGLRTLVGDAAVVRAAGADRYATAIEVNHLAFASLSPGDSYVASGAGFADGLSVGVLAGRAKRPVYLSIPYCTNGSVRSELARASTTRLRLVGGPGAVRGLVGALEPCRSLTRPDSLWALPNKQRRLDPVSYAPKGLVRPDVATVNGHALRPEAAQALESMLSAARTEGAGRMALLSGYRSYATQVVVRRQEVALKGEVAADRTVAPPGFSEHQLGLGVDLTPLGDAACEDYRCIGSTPQGRWLAANATRFGFVLRYESGRTSTTGYSPEPWHFRYVGTALARDYAAGGFHTLEDYFGLAPAPSY